MASRPDWGIGKGTPGQVAFNLLAILNQRGAGGILQRIGIVPVRPDGAPVAGIDMHLESVSTEFFEQGLGADSELVGVLLPVAAIDGIQRLFVRVGIDVVVRARHKTLPARAFPAGSREGCCHRHCRPFRPRSASGLCPGGPPAPEKLQPGLRSWQARRGRGCQCGSNRHYYRSGKDVLLRHERLDQAGENIHLFPLLSGPAEPPCRIDAHVRRICPFRVKSDVHFLHGVDKERPHELRLFPWSGGSAAWG